MGTDDRTRADKALDHIWRYFELHANQRLTLFNFFLVLSGITAAGFAATIQGSSRFALLGVVLGFLLALISFVFWKLDQRVSFLLKHAENAILFFERDLIPGEGRIYENEPAAFSLRRAEAPLWKRPWTYGRSLRVVFLAMAIFGLGGAAVAALRFATAFSW